LALYLSLYNESASNYFISIAFFNQIMLMFVTLI
jgi:hypothetical protein